MISALDANVIIDVVRGDEHFGPGSREAVRTAALRGSVVVCEVVWAEVVALFDDVTRGAAVLENMSAGLLPISRDGADRAGVLWRAYRRAGGPRERLMADFLVAGHASEQADVLVTRDRGFARSHFGDLAIIDPSANG